jgi:hypothetical protein
VVGYDSVQSSAAAGQSLTPTTHRRRQVRLGFTQAALRAIFVGPDVPCCQTGIAKRHEGVAGAVNGTPVRVGVGVCVGVGVGLGCSQGREWEYADQSVAVCVGVCARVAVAVACSTRAQHSQSRTTYSSRILQRSLTRSRGRTYVCHMRRGPGGRSGGGSGSRSVGAPKALSGEHNMGHSVAGQIRGGCHEGCSAMLRRTTATACGHEPSFKHPPATHFTLHRLLQRGP